MAGQPGGSFGQGSDLGSGHDLTVCEFKPRIGLSAVSAESAWDYLCLRPSPSLLALSLSLSLSLSVLLCLSVSKINIFKT